jgi:NADPH:quinone reductase-like Zn-dependent oxidoreductase
VRAVICTRYGPPNVLRLEEVDTPAPKPGEVCLRIHATAVTSSDTYVRSLPFPFAYQVMARLVLGITAPRRSILGMVMSGDVAATGRGVTAFREGDQVFGMDIRAFGTYAEYVCWPQKTVLAARPRNLSPPEVAALPYGGLLAMHFLRKAGIRSGQHIVVYGASGAVGTSAVQLARHFGASVTGVCGPTNLDLVRALGAEVVINYTSEDFTLGDERYDIVFDAVGRRKSAKALAQARRVLSATGQTISVDDGSPKLLTSDLVLLRDLAEAGEIKPVIDRIYPLEQIVEAHRYVDAGHKKGNVIITID